MSFVLLGILNSQAAGAGGAGAYDLLETVEPTSASSITFTGLDTLASDYRHLQIRLVARSSFGALFNESLRITVNSDTGANYAFHDISVNPPNVLADNSTSRNFMEFFIISADGEGANEFGAGTIDILDFSSSNKNTTIRNFAGHAGTTVKNVAFQSGLYNNTAAITSINIQTDSNRDYVSGTRFSLYGVR